MDKEIKTLGLIIRTSDYKENDKIATLFSRELGRIDVSIRGCKKQGASLMGASSLFCYGDYLLYNANGRMGVTSCDIKHSFYNISEDVEKLGAATFAAEVAGDIATPMENHSALFALIINLLSFLEQDVLTPKEMLFCFCIKICDIFGVRPILGECSMCGEPGYIGGFSIAQGGVVCKNCSKMERVNPVKGDHLKMISWVLGTRNSELGNLPDIDDYALRLMMKYMTVNLSISSKRTEFIKKIGLVK